MSDSNSHGKRDTRPTTFEEFWPSYVRAHSNKTNRKLHFVGTTLAMVCLGGAALLRKPSLLIAAPLVGYGFAWVGHFGFEKNIPATFSNPLWSFRADFKMWTKIANGTMDAEVERVLSATDEPAAKTDAASGARAEATAN